MPAIFNRAREPMNSYTHFAGAALSALGLLIMGGLLLAVEVSTQITLACIVFCISLIALYCASGFYHFSNSSAKIIAVLRKIDHSMIFVLIAGTYTPLLLSILPSPKSILFVSFIWAAALLGILMKLCWMRAPRWLSTLLYLAMGWAIVADLPALKALGTLPLMFLVAGGLTYTVGAVIYALKKPNISARFGFHEIFHLFIVAGSIMHYLMVICLICQ